MRAKRYLEPGLHLRYGSRPYAVVWGRSPAGHGCVYPAGEPMSRKCVTGSRRVPAFPLRVAARDLAYHRGVTVVITETDEPVCDHREVYHRAVP